MDTKLPLKRSSSSVDGIKDKKVWLGVAGAWRLIFRATAVQESQEGPAGAREGASIARGLPSLGHPER